MSDQPPFRSTLANDPQVCDVIPTFVARLPAHAKRLQELVAAGDTEGLKLLAHKLRGAGTSFGFEPITRHAGEIEELLGGGATVELVAGRVLTLIAFMRRVDGFKDE